MLKSIPCTAKTLAVVIGLSERRVSELTRVRVFTKPYDLVACVQAYVRFLRTEPGKLKDERARLVKAQASLEELKLRARTGELVRRDAVGKRVFAMNRSTRDNFLNLPSRTDALVAAESDRQRCFDILNKEVLQILTGLADGLQEDRDVDSRAESRPVAWGRGAVPRHDSRGARRHRGQDRGCDGL
jgi:hypothetical protein